MLFVCHPQILHKHCLQFLLGVKMAPRETENNAYAKFWRDKQRTLWYVMVFLEWSRECFHSRGQHLCKFIGTKESVCIRKEFNSHRTGLGHQHGRRFIVLGHQYGRRDVMWKHSIAFLPFSLTSRSSLLKLRRERSDNRKYFWHPGQEEACFTNVSWFCFYFNFIV